MSMPPANIPVAQGSTTPTRDIGSKRPDRHALYLAVLNWSFAIFSSTRLLTYAPTLWAIYRSGDSGQHSLWTWVAWVGSNAVMAAWLYENNQRGVNRAIAVTAGNAAMCLATCVLILWYR